MYSIVFMFNICKDILFKRHRKTIYGSMIKIEDNAEDKNNENECPSLLPTCLQENITSTRIRKGRQQVWMEETSRGKLTPL